MHPVRDASWRHGEGEQTAPEIEETICGDGPPQMPKRWLHRMTPHWWSSGLTHWNVPVGTAQIIFLIALHRWNSWVHTRFKFFICDATCHVSSLPWKEEVWSLSFCPRTGRWRRMKQRRRGPSWPSSCPWAWRWVLPCPLRSGPWSKIFQPSVDVEWTTNTAHPPVTVGVGLLPQRFPSWVVTPRQTRTLQDLSLPPTKHQLIRF